MFDPNLFLDMFMYTLGGTLVLVLCTVLACCAYHDQEFRKVVACGLVLIGGMSAVTTALYLNYPLDPHRIAAWFLGHWEIIWLAAVVSLAGGFALRSRSNRAFIWALTKVTVTYLGAVALLTLTYFSVTQLLIKYGVLN